MNELIFPILLFLSILLPTAIILHARLVRPLQLTKRANILWAIAIFAIILLAASGIPLTAFLTAHAQTAPLIFPIIYCAYLAMSFLILLVACMCAKDLVGLFVKIYHFCKNHIHRTNDSAKTNIPTTIGNTSNIPPHLPRDNNQPEDISRRHFIQRASTLVAAGTAAMLVPVSIYHAKAMHKIRRFDIELPNIPKQLHGLRIVHLSDIHVGNTMYESDIARIVEKTNSLHPDLIAITGDMADGSAHIIGSWLNPMRNFKAKYGTYFCTGNHDHMSGAREWCQVIESLGIHTLNNEHRLLNVNGATLAVAGAIDARGDRHNPNWISQPEKALANIPNHAFKLMLVHQPASVDRSLAAGAHLVLVGHTHGGQFWPLCYLIDAIHTYSRGLYKRHDKAVFVSCGTGYWGPPFRLGVPPEIDVLTLRAIN